LPLPDIDASLQAVDYAFGTLNADGVTMLSNIDGHYPGESVCGRARIAVAPASSAWNRSSSASSCESGIPWVSQA
jgi:hypothetical protein